MIGNNPPPKVVVNELTTVASAFTNARFLKGEAISGNPLGLKIAAGNVPNLVDPATGGWGKTLLDPINSTQTTTLATFDTLGSLITAYATWSSEDWRGRFLKAATPTGGPQPTNTLEAIAGVAAIDDRPGHQGRRQGQHEQLLADHDPTERREGEPVDKPGR